MLDALLVLLHPMNLAMLLAGIAIGIVIGILPGIGGVTGLALLIPFTLGLSPEMTLPLLLGMLAVTNTSDTFTCVILGTPGTIGSQATIVDGYPMAKRGEAERALGASFTASVVGGVIGAAVLTVSLPILRPVVLAFGSPEFFTMGVLGLTMAGILGGSFPLRGIIGAGLGLLIGMIGQDPIYSVPRWYMGFNYLLDPISIVPIALGLFAIPELVELCASGTQIAAAASYRSHQAGKMAGVRDFWRHRWLGFWSSIVGTLVGFLPGMGTAVANWLAYAFAVIVSKPRDQFGKGDIRGVIAPEAANNACLGGALIPTVAFGVPGGSATALLLAALWVAGVPTGPKLLTEKISIVYIMIWSVALANVLGGLICFLMSDQLAKLTRVNINRLAPFLILTIFAGAMISRRHIGDLVALVAFGALGWAMKRFEWPRPPIILGVVLSPIIERYLFISNMNYGAAWLTRPLVLVILALTILGVILGIVVRKSTEKSATPATWG